MTSVTEIPWDTVADPAFGADQAAWRDAVTQIAAKATAKLPASAGRIERALTLVLSGAVTLHDDGSATVRSSQANDIAYTVARGTCSCPDYPRAPHSFCKHRLASAIARRALALTQPAPDQENTVTEPDTAVHTPAPTLPAELLPYIVYLHGRPFIQYSGLLTLAHTRGLVSLEAILDLVTPELALASAVAVFSDGRRFREAADATPGNVGSTVRAHYPRIALTRSKARVLRDALGITAVALEELGDD